MTKLTGRYLEFKMYPLTFDEYLGMKNFMKLPIDSDITAELENYINEGGFPKTLSFFTYIYAKAKEYAVSVGRIGKLECDFIMRNGIMHVNIGPFMRNGKCSSS